MNEQLVTMEVALVALHSGFNDPCRYAFEHGQREPIEVPYYDGDGSGWLQNSRRGDTSSGTSYLCSCPTLDQLVRWLRKTHNIYIRHAASHRNGEPLFCFSPTLLNSPKWYEGRVVFETLATTEDADFDQGLLRAVLTSFYHLPPADVQQVSQ